MIRTVALLGLCCISSISGSFVSGFVPHNNDGQVIGSVSVSSSSPLLPRYPSALSVSSSFGSSSGESNKKQNAAGAIKRSRLRKNKNEDDMTLYDVLGANPNDSQETLKRRYLSLVKSLHPDAAFTRAMYFMDGASGADGVSSSQNLSQINAAWQVLGDPKERLRYDRSLQAKEIAEGIEAFVDFGFKTAIPFFRKTADTTAAAVDVSSKAAQKAVDASSRVAQKGAQQAKVAYGVFELETKSRQLEQRAAMDTTKAERIGRDIASVPMKKLSSIQDKNAALSFAEAQRLYKKFMPLLDEVSTNAGRRSSLDTDSLEVFRLHENDFQESTRAHLASQKKAQQATRRVQQTSKAEAQALKRLEEAQRALQEAQINHSIAQDEESNALQLEQSCRSEVTKAESILFKTKEKVRVGLVQQEDKYWLEQAKLWREEQQELNSSARALQQEAKALKKAAQDLDRKKQQQQS